MVDLRSQINATKFQILEIPLTSGSAEIKQAFNRLCRIWHPDKAADRKDPNVKRRHENHFNRLLEAKEYLLIESNRFMESIRRETAYIAPKYESGGIPASSTPSPAEYPPDSQSPSIPSPPPCEAAAFSGETAATTISSAGLLPKKKSSGGIRGVSEGEGFSEKISEEVPSFKETKRGPMSFPDYEEVFLGEEGMRPPFVAASTARSQSEREPLGEEFERFSLEQLINHQQAMTRSLDSLKMQQTEKQVELAGLGERGRAMHLDSPPSTRILTQKNVIEKELKTLQAKIEKKLDKLKTMTQILKIKTEASSANLRRASQCDSTPSASAGNPPPTTEPDPEGISSNSVNGLDETLLDESENDALDCLDSSTTSSQSSSTHCKRRTHTPVYFPPNPPINGNEAAGVSPSEKKRRGPPWNPPLNPNPSDAPSLEETSLPPWMDSSTRTSPLILPTHEASDETLPFPPHEPRVDLFTSFEESISPDKLTENPIHYSFHVVTDTTSVTTAPPPPPPLLHPPPPSPIRSEEEENFLTPSTPLVHAPDTTFLYNLLEASMGNHEEKRLHPHALPPKGGEDGDPTVPLRRSAYFPSTDPLFISSPLTNGHGTQPSIVTASSLELPHGDAISGTISKHSSPLLTSTSQEAKLQPPNLHSSPSLSLPSRGNRATHLSPPNQAASGAQKRVSSEQAMFYDTKSFPFGEETSLMSSPIFSISKSSSASRHKSNPEFTAKVYSPLVEVTPSSKNPVLMHPQWPLGHTREGQRLVSQRLAFPEETLPKTILLPTAYASPPSTERLSSMGDLYGHSSPENEEASDDTFSEEDGDTDVSEMRHFMPLGEKSDDET
ncbi:DnaJ domain-containing protein [Cardiosporidium cionae]|uniref:DnaJ domain-containing protein n=1 Tax=Cardiosporidium cionae TaxID=476202 RepID=A0ABQ7J4Y3_9APIC|nr:DnaJ domain-containing protein [Cardiosporidium cionae]|eukprot:KAF8818761.1 DnaJ domain-containing protein [Cardiosporidium cionae]